MKRRGVMIGLTTILLGGWVAAAQAQDRCFGFGLATDLPVAGDWDGAGGNEVGIFRSGHWSLDYNGNGVWDGTAIDRAYNGFGQAGDQPIAGDWNGDGQDKPGYFRNGSWVLDLNGNFLFDGCSVDGCGGFGLAGDMAVTGDWDGNGSDEIGVFRNGVWLLDINGNRAWDGPEDDATFGFGLAGDLAVAGDWNGDGSDEIGVYRSGIWSLDYNGNRLWDGIAVDRAYSFGGVAHLPVVGDWNAAGGDEIATFDAAYWVLDLNGNGAFDSCSTGPIPAALPDVALLYEDRSVRIDVLANDEDPLGGPLTVTLVRWPVDGTAEVLASGEILYRPDTGFDGADSLRYRVTNGGGGFAEAEVSLTVRPALPATRSRPALGGGALRADNGSLLRGAFWNFDITGGQLPTQAQVTAMRTQGFNALHLYAEAPGCGEAGIYLSQTMTLSDWAKGAGLYLIVTIGNGNGICSTRDATGESIFIDFAKRFWYQYAQAFADEEHVVFELYNEPFHRFIGGGLLLAQPATPLTRELEVEAYLAAREHASDTAILLYSYGTLHDAAGADADMEAVETEVLNRGESFYGVGLAFHGYTFPKSDPDSIDTLEQAIAGVQNLGYDVVMTENRALRTTAECVAPGQDATLPNFPCIEARMIHLLERYEVSWTSFIKLSQLGGAGFDQKFRTQIDHGIGGSSVVWLPDFGTWPSRLAAPQAGSQLFLQSKGNGNWVSTSALGVSPGLGPLAADRSIAGGWEKFEVVQSFANKVCLKSKVIETNFPSRDPFVDPGVSSDTTALIANRPTCTGAIAFEWLELPAGDVVLRVFHNASVSGTKPGWRFVNVDVGGSPPNLFDASTLAGDAERFVVQSTKARGQ